MSNDTKEQINIIVKKVMEEIRDIHTQQNSASNSQLLRMINDNTKMTQDILDRVEKIQSHQMFKLWEDGTGTIRLLKWLAIPMMAIIGFIIVMKDGFSIIRKIF